MFCLLKTLELHILLLATETFLAQFAYRPCLALSLGSNSNAPAHNK